MKKRQFKIRIAIKCNPSLSKKLLFLLTLFPLWGFAQQQRITINLKNVDIREIFKEINRQTELDFVYGTEELEKMGTVSLQVENETLESVLTKLFKDSAFEYVIKMKSIIIKKRDKELLIKGKIVDEKKEPLFGVTIIIKGTTVGTTSLENGRFSLSVPRPDKKPLVLQFSFIGMKTLEKVYNPKIHNNAEWIITLTEDMTQLEEVVVNTGYQSFNYRNLTSAVTSLKMDDIMVPGMTSVDQMLEGHVPGMTFLQNSGQVGAAPKLRIRGTSTILGNQEPLWVVDGIVMTDPVDISPEQINDLDFVNLVGNAISGINPEDIEQIDVLKDAAATATYGPKAGNGVIVITTKKGKIGRPSITYSFSGGFRRRMRYSDRAVNMMNSKERIAFSRELMEKEISYPKIDSWLGYEAVMKDYYEGKISYGEMQKLVGFYESINTDWFGHLLKDAFSNNHTLSISGGNENTRYYASMGYDDAQGNIRKESNKRYSANVNISIQFKRFSLNVGINGNIQKRTYTPSNVGIMDYAYGMSRALPLYNENGDLWYYSKYTSSSMYKFNILNERENCSNSVEGSSIMLNTRLGYMISERIKTNVIFSYKESNTNQQTWFGENSFYAANLARRNIATGKIHPFDTGRSLLPIGGELQEENQKNESYTGRWELNLSQYLDPNSLHYISASVFGEVSSSVYKGMNKTIRGYMKERGMLISSIDGDKYPAYKQWVMNNPASLGVRKHSISNRIAGIMTFMYTYKNLYILNANLRVDASNKFGQSSNNKFLPIWSVSGRWNTKEDLFANKKWINDLSLKASFGYQGNMLDTQSPKLIIRKKEHDNRFEELISEIVNFPNPKLRWEKIMSVNTAIEFSFLNNKVRGALGYYYRKTTDAYMNKIVSAINGVREYTVNTGTLINQGYEFLFSFNLFNNLNFSKEGEIGGFSWRIDPQIGSIYNQLINKLKRRDRVLEERDINRITYEDYLSGKIPITDYAINSFFSYRFKGLDPRNGQPLFKNIEEENKEAYKEMTKEQLFLSVMEYSGCRTPFISGGVANTFQFRNIVLYINLAYSLGSKIRLLKMYPDVRKEYGSIAPQPRQNVRREFLERWRYPGDEKHTNIPGILSGKEFEKTLKPWWKEVRGMPKFSENIWQMYDDSNIRVVSGNYIKLQSFSLRYIVPAKLCKNWHVSSAYINFSGSNLFTIASRKLKGQDPTQSGSSSWINISVPAMYNLSFNVSF